MSSFRRHPNHPTDESIARAAAEFRGSGITQAQEFISVRWGAYVRRASASGYHESAGEIYEILWTGFVDALTGLGRKLKDQ